MRINLLQILITCIFFTCLLLFCCDNGQSEDVQVLIDSTYTTTHLNYHAGVPHYLDMANVCYSVENTGTKIVNGWEVYFNVKLIQGPQLVASDNIYCDLESGEISPIHIAQVIIPSYYDKAISSALRNIEIW